MYKLGLIGTPISHSFSKKYFDTKFKKENINNFTYSLYDIKKIQNVNLIIKQGILGLNVTQPYKKDVIQYLDELDGSAKYTKSVNTIFISPINKKKYGFNTDCIGFENLLSQLVINNNTHALILGSGGVSRTVSFILQKININHKIVSRNPQKKEISYQELLEYISKSLLIVNTTPLGQYPNNYSFPNIPYKLITPNHQCIDLIYNPKKTIFLKNCESKGAHIINGEKMFITQAEASWAIWNKMLKIR